MKKLILFPIRLAGFAVKCAAWLAVLALVVVLLGPGLAEQEPCTECQVLRTECQTLREELERASEALDTEYLLRRRIDLRLLPGLGLDWLRVETVAFWDDVGLRHFERCPEGTSETVWSGMLLECSLTTLERSSSR